MTGINLLVDSVSVFSPGGRILQAELTASLDRTCPAGASAVVLRRPDQPAVSGFENLRDECVSTKITNRLDKWTWLRSGFPAKVDLLAPAAVFAAGGMVAPGIRRRCGVVATTNSLALFVPIADLPDHASYLSKIRALIARRLVVRTLQGADAIVLHSHHALDTLTRFTGDIASKTSVVLTGVPGPARLNPSGPIPEHPYGGRPYLLYLSAVHWYKNHLRLIEAYRLLSQRTPDLPDLILAGFNKDPHYLEQIRSAISSSSMDDRIRYLGDLPSSELPAWLHHATINVFPSLHETNSVIQAEILGMHGVMATSKTSSMPEVAGSAAEYFDARDPVQIANAIETLWRSPERRKELRRLAALRADELSWDECGRVIWRAAQTAAELFRARSR